MKREYNLVIEDNHCDCPKNELLTDKELLKFRIKPKTRKVNVNSDAVYFCFGVRFSSDYE